ncbi:MAG: GWxTD domain-containing protein [Bacteroidales bacterium]|nr:GWxTD domain-containing protein [Bacteroidales bacterium]
MNRHFFLLFIFLCSCVTTVYVPSVNLAENYDENFQSPLIDLSNFETKINSGKDSNVTALRFVFRHSSFLSKNENNQYQILLRVRVLLFRSMKKSAILDSFSFSHSLPINSSSPDTFIIIKYRPAFLYPIHALIEITDLHKNKTFQYVWFFEKLLYVNEKNHFPLCYNQRRIVSLYDTIKFYLEKQPTDFNITHCTFADFPDPPFAVSSPVWRVTSETSIQIKKDSTYLYSFIAEKEGLYVLRSASEDGIYAWLVTKKDFPMVNTYEAMAYPMRYITTQKEYDDLFQGENLAEKVEKFWLKLGGTEEMARQLIRRFYHRVVRANELFTNHVEGWKTDRGMIYVVMGPPGSVYRNDQSEIWVYGQENNWMSMQFRFIKREILPKLYEYVLERNSQYRDIWYNMIEIWRR